jgi:hypothetical protein
MNFTITLQEPYGADLNMGPGSVTLRFADNGGVADGSAFLTDYDLTQDFVTGINLASVHTDLQNDAVDSCGVATGDLAGTALTWAPMSMADHCQNGQISCTGLLCGSFGAPAEDTPEVITDDCGDHPLETFNFSPDLSSFTMEAVVLSQDENATAALNYVGTLVSSDLDPNTPACLCP